MSGRARGFCCDCDQDRIGRVVGDVEQNSGPGRTVIICDECSTKLKGKHGLAPVRERARTH